MPEFEISADERKQMIDWIGTRKPVKHVIGSSSDGRDAFIVEGESVIFYRMMDGQNMVSAGLTTLEGLKADLYNEGFGELFSRAVVASNQFLNTKLERQQNV